jgi:hypothetical protein
MMSYIISTLIGAEGRSETGWGSSTWHSLASGGRRRKSYMGQVTPIPRVLQPPRLETS